MTSSLNSIDIHDPVEHALTIDDNVPPPRHGRTHASVSSSVAFGIPGGRISTAGRSMTAEIGSDAVATSKLRAYTSGTNVVVTSRRPGGSMASKRSSRRDDKNLGSIAEEHQEHKEHQDHKEHKEPKERKDSLNGRDSIGGRSIRDVKSLASIVEKHQDNIHDRDLHRVRPSDSPSASGSIGGQSSGA